MRIATWNINGLRARLDFVRAWLTEREPDIVGLQELKLAEDAFPHEALSGLGYHVAVHGQKQRNGVAILARAPIEQIERGLPGHEAWGARLISADIRGLRFATVYCPNGKTPEHTDYRNKLLWLDALVAHWRERSAANIPSVLCGDFNIAPADIDSHHPDGYETGIFHTPEERARFRAFQELGVVDLFRAVHPETQAFSWWDYRNGAFHRRLGLRIDLLLASEALRARVSDVVIDRDYRKKRGELKPSDHAPVYADLEWGGP